MKSCTNRPMYLRASLLKHVLDSSSNPPQHKHLHPIGSTSQQLLQAPSRRAQASSNKLLLVAKIVDILARADPFETTGDGRGWYTESGRSDVLVGRSCQALLTGGASGRSVREAGRGAAREGAAAWSKHRTTSAR